MTPAIRVENLGKCYRVSHNQQRRGYRTLRDTLVNALKAPFRCRCFGAQQTGTSEDFWALQDVSFEVQPGEVIGVIGRNGAGKSTLLKILARIAKPTTGRAELSGRVGSLLEVGTGFHPELTGRENIYLNGSIIGMRKAEIDRKFAGIVDFSGVEKFLDTPVKRYSSGMYVRLAFAVAAHLDPEILVVDEVLAVGDDAFQKKCLGKMSEVAAGGRTVLFVSHNLPMLMRLCPSAIWLEAGQVVSQGSTDQIVKLYCDPVKCDTGAIGAADLREHPGRPHGSPGAIEAIRFRDGNGNLRSGVGLGESLTIEVDIKKCHAMPEMTVEIDICDTFGTLLVRLHSRIQSMLRLSGEQATQVSCTIEDVRLLPGAYSINLGVGDTENYRDRIINAFRFNVDSRDIYNTGRLPKQGLLATAARWVVNNRDIS